MGDVLHWLATTQADGINNVILLLWLFLAGQTVTSKHIGRNIKAVRAVAVAAIFMVARVILANVLMTFPDQTGPQVAGVLTNDFFRIGWNGAALIYSMIWWGLAQWHRTKIITRRKLISQGRLPAKPFSPQEN